MTEYLSDLLTVLGIDTDEFDANSKIVNFSTIDGIGNTTWFNDVANPTQFDVEGNLSLEAGIEIVGGTGKFQGASGMGTVSQNLWVSEG